MTTRGTWRGLWGSVAILAWAGLATGQTTGTERVQRLSASQRVVIGATTFGTTSPLQVVGLPAKTSQTACAWLDGSGNVFTGACPTGTVSSVGLTMPSIFSVSGSPITTSGTLAVSLANQSAYTVFARGASTGVPSFQALAKGHLPAATVFTDQANTFSGSYTQTFSGPVAINNGIGSHLIPLTTDIYNLGSSTKLWNEGFLAQLNAVIFAETTATLFGGYSIIGKNAGSFPARVASSDTTIDFGKAMTVGHFIAIRAHDEGGSLPTAEHLQVGSLVSGTTYNVTRNLSGLGAKNWPAGTSYLVSGTTGDGRIELRAYSTPQISILTQGAAYNAQTEQVRIGYLDGMPGMAAGKIGIYIGDVTGTEGLSYYDGVLTVRGTLNADDITAGTITGRTLQTAASGNRIVVDATPSLTWYGPIAGVGTWQLGTITASGLSVTAQNNNLLTAGEMGYKFAGPTMASTDRWGLFGNYNAVSGDYNKAVRLASRWTTADAANVYLESTAGSESATVQLNVIGSASTVNITADALAVTGDTGLTGGLTINPGNGIFQGRNVSTTGIEWHVRAGSGKDGFVTFTEDSVADRWVIKSATGSTALVFGSGSVGSHTARVTFSAAGNVSAASFTAAGSAGVSGTCSAVTVTAGIVTGCTP